MVLQTVNTVSFNRSYRARRKYVVQGGARDTEFNHFGARESYEKEHFPEEKMKSIPFGMVKIIAASTGIGTLASPSVFREFGVVIGTLFMVVALLFCLLANIFLMFSAERIAAKGKDDTLHLDYSATVDKCVKGLSFVFVVFMALDFLGGWALYTNAIFGFAKSIGSFIYQKYQGTDLELDFTKSDWYSIFAVVVLFGVLFLVTFSEFVDSEKKRSVEKARRRTEEKARKDAQEKAPESAEEKAKKSAEAVAPESEEENPPVSACRKVVEVIMEWAPFFCILAIIIAVMLDYFQAKEVPAPPAGFSKWTMRFPRGETMFHSLRDMAPLMAVSFLIQHMLLDYVGDMARKDDHKIYKARKDMSQLSKEKKIDRRSLKYIFTTKYFFAMLAAELIVLVIFLLIGVTGFWQYGSLLQDNIIDNKPQNIEWMVMRVCYTVILISIMPDQWKSCVKMINDYLDPEVKLDQSGNRTPLPLDDGGAQKGEGDAEEGEGHNRCKKSCSFSDTSCFSKYFLNKDTMVYLACVLMPLLIVVSIPSLLSIFGIFGGVVDSLIMFVFPAILFWRALSENATGSLCENVYELGSRCDDRPSIITWRFLAVLVGSFGVSLFSLGVWIAFGQSTAVCATILSLVSLVFLKGFFDSIKICLEAKGEEAQRS